MADPAPPFRSLEDFVRALIRLRQNALGSGLSEELLRHLKGFPASDDRTAVLAWLDRAHELSKALLGEIASAVATRKVAEFELDPRECKREILLEPIARATRHLEGLRAARFPQQQREFERRVQENFAKTRSAHDTYVTALGFEDDRSDSSTWVVRLKLDAWETLRSWRREAAAVVRTKITGLLEGRWEEFVRSEVHEVQKILGVSTFIPRVPVEEGRFGLIPESEGAQPEERMDLHALPSGVGSGFLASLFTRVPMLAGMLAVSAVSATVQRVMGSGWRAALNAAPSIVATLTAIGLIAIWVHRRTEATRRLLGEPRLARAREALSQRVIADFAKLLGPTQQAYEQAVRQHGREVQAQTLAALQRVIDEEQGRREARFQQRLREVTARINELHNELEILKGVSQVVRVTVLTDIALARSRFERTAGAGGVVR